MFHPPDLIVLDLRVPKANGIEVASRLNLRMANTPVVVFTMFEDKLSTTLTKIASGNRTSDVLALHLSDYRVYQEL
jgi:DNA-binding NarL/FixJ family response regulator